MLIVPLTLEAEYRGKVDSREYDFQDRSTGERVQGASAERVKFEYDVPGQEGVQLVVPIKAVDGAADFDVTSLKKGDRVTLEGTVHAAERGEDRGSRVDLAKVRRVGAAKLSQAA